MLRGILDAPDDAASHVEVADGLLWLLPCPGHEPAPNWLDADFFEREAGRARASRDAATCRAALAVYTGAYLPEDHAEEWAVRRREELQELYLALLLHLAALCRVSGEREEAEQALATILRIDPCHEEAARALIRMYLAERRPLPALRAYRRLETALREELDLQPEPRTRALYETLLAARAAAPQPSSGAVETPPGNLPTALTSFIGRRGELAALRDALVARDAAATPEVERAAFPTPCRLLTLTGAGGSGKTRLALQVADEVLEEYPDGVWLVELAPLADARLVPRAVVMALGLQHERAAPGQSDSSHLCQHLRSKRLLLLLDNCEHVVAACADLAGQLLRACPRLTILATSREALGVQGERPWLVPPLDLPRGDVVPPPDGLLHCEAVRLFLERARVHRPTFALTAANAAPVLEICRRLDGLPLAIELAAARMAALPVEAIAARLDARFRLLTTGNRAALPRHRTLRAAMDWSYDLLDRPEQALLRRLAVFAGGWTLEAAEAICADEPLPAPAADGSLSAPASGEPLPAPWNDGRVWSALPRADVLDLLDALVAKSLVQTDEQDDALRYRLLETVRQYAHERLEEAGEYSGARERHLAWYGALAERAEHALMGAEQERWLARLETEHDNLRAALRWADETGRAEQAIGMVAALGRFWLMHGYLSEGDHWLRRLLAPERAGARHAPAAVRARALNCAGEIARFRGEYERAEALLEEALALYRAVDDRDGIAATLYNLGRLAHAQGRLEHAAEHYEASLALHRARDDAQATARVLTSLGALAEEEGQLARAAAFLEESLTLYGTVRDERGVAMARSNLAVLARRQGDLARAAALCRAIMAANWSSRDTIFLSVSLLGAALVARDAGRQMEAVTLFEAAAALRESLGVQMSPAERAEHDEIVEEVRSVLGGEQFAAAWAAGRAMPPEQAVAYGDEVLSRINDS